MTAEVVLERPRKVAVGTISLEAALLPPEQREAIAAEVSRQVKDGIAALLAGEPLFRQFKGREYHAEIRRRVYAMLERGPVSYDDIQADLWMQEHAHFTESVQWTREQRQFLLKPGRRPYPPPDPGQGKLVQFNVPSGARGSWYLSKVETGHCDIEQAVRRENVSRSRQGQVIRRLREQYGCTDEMKCARCGPVLRGEARTP